MKQVKTAKGRVIDMAALARVNEDVRAVSPGNEKMNGRGDRIDGSGNVLQTVQTKARAQHNTTTAPETCNLSDAPGAPKKTPVKKPEPAKKPDPMADLATTVVNETKKTRENGTTYTETEYADGSMDTTDK
jgi:activator of HSP90 ATPase